MFRFIHSADLHLGKPFPKRFGDELPPKLREARIGCIGRLAAAARARGAATAILAGDVFDAAEPAPAVVAQALDAMAAETDVEWWLLPGNHDPHRPGGLWERLALSHPPNLRLLLQAAPVMAAPGLALLPAPCVARNPGMDPTAWMDGAETPQGALRLGVAHGPALAFDEDGQSDPIAPDRADRAGLDYLALGDWHGAVEIGPRAFYSGAPEPDRFKDNAQGFALAVTLDGPGAPPVVEHVPTARFHWVKATLELTPGALWEPMLRALEPRTAPRRDALIALTLTGELALHERTALEGFLEAFGQGLAHLSVDRGGLRTRRSLSDLDEIAVAGPLRAAAEALLADATDDRLDRAARDAAREALDLLYALAVGERGETRQ